jgi:hypothetical protein
MNVCYKTTKKTLNAYFKQSNYDLILAGCLSVPILCSCVKKTKIIAISPPKPCTNKLVSTISDCICVSSFPVLSNVNNLIESFMCGENWGNVLQYPSVNNFGTYLKAMRNVASSEYESWYYNSSKVFIINGNQCHPNLKKSIQKFINCNQICDKTTKPNKCESSADECESSADECESSDDCESSADECESSADDCESSADDCESSADDCESSADDCESSSDDDCDEKPKCQKKNKCDKKPKCEKKSKCDEKPKCQKKNKCEKKKQCKTNKCDDVCDYDCLEDCPEVECPEDECLVKIVDCVEKCQKPPKCPKQCKPKTTKKLCINLLQEQVNKITQAQIKSFKALRLNVQQIKDDCGENDISTNCLKQLKNNNQDLTECIKKNNALLEKIGCKYYSILNCSDAQDKEDTDNVIICKGKCYPEDNTLTEVDYKKKIIAAIQLSELITLTSITLDKVLCIYISNNNSLSKEIQNAVTALLEAMCVLIKKYNELNSVIDTDDIVAAVNGFNDQLLTTNQKLTALVVSLKPNPSNICPPPEPDCP